MAIVSVPAGTPTQIASGTASVAINTSTGAVTITPTSGQNAVLANGQLLVPDGTAPLPSFAYSAEPGSGFRRTGTKQISFTFGNADYARIDGNGAGIYTEGAPIWANGSALGIGSGGTLDVRLERDAADTLAQRRGANGQKRRQYFQYTDASNYSRLVIDTSSTEFIIASEGAGSSAPWPIHIRTASAQDLRFYHGTTQTWTINGSGHLISGAADNTVDIGASGATRPRDFHLARNALFKTTELGSGSGGILAIGNATTVPSTNPTVGGVLYTEGGAGKFRGSSGTITVFAPA